MTIQNWDAFRRSIWNWKPLRPCFKRGIEPTDIDGFVEIGGVFLVLEGKAPGVPLKEGQRCTFERLHHYNDIVPGLFTIIVLWGDAESGRIDRLQFWPRDPFDGGWPALITYISAWAELAERRGAIQSEALHRESLPTMTPAYKLLGRPMVDTDINW